MTLSNATSYILKFLFQDDEIGLIESLAIIDENGKLTTLKNLRDEQKDIIAHILKGCSLVILKPRQIGSSTAALAALFCIWLLSEEPIHIVILSHKQSSSKELLEKVKTMYEGLPPAIRAIKPCEITASQMKLKDSGARFTARGARDKGGIRSFTCTHLMLSEFAFAENPEELLSTALAALNKGQLIIESTANHYEDALHRQITRTIKGETGYQFLFFPWTSFEKYRSEPDPSIKATQANASSADAVQEEEGLSPEQLTWRRQQIARMGEAKFKREYPRSVDEAYAQLAGCFIEDAYLKKLKQLSATKDKVCRHIKPTQGTRYVIGVDTAMGLSQDDSSIHVLDCKTLDVVSSFRSNTTPLTKLADITSELSYEYGVGSPNGKAVVNIESNAEGMACVQQLQRMGIPVHLINGKPWKTGAHNKPELLETVRAAIHTGSLKSVDEPTYTELRSVQIDNYGKVQFSRKDTGGSHADGIISLGLALIAAQQVSIPKQLPTGAYLPVKPLGRR